MRESGEDDDKGKVSDIEGVQSLSGRDVKFHEGWDLCLRGSGDEGGGGGGGVDGSDGGGGVDGSGVGDSGEGIVYRSGGGEGSVVCRRIRGGLCRSG